MQSPSKRRKLERLAREVPSLPGGLAARLGLEDGERQRAELGEALDSLVRSMAHRDRLSEGLARRVHGLWSALPEPAIELHPTELVHTRHTLLAADARRGRWILPAHMAGLRRLTPGPGWGPEDVMRLAFELARLGPDEAAILGFADWLACDGIEGLGLGTYPPSAVLGSALSVRSLLSAPHLGELSRRAVDGWNGRAWQLSRSPGAASAATRFRSALQRHQQLAQAGRLEMSPQERAQLRGEVDEASHWSRVELQTLLQDGMLRQGLGARRLASRLQALIGASERIDDALLCFLTGLSEGGHGALLRGLDGASIGEQMADRLELETVDPARLSDVLASLGSATSAATVRRLLERAGDEASAGALVAAMLRARGLSALLGHVEPLREPRLVGRFYAAALASGEPVARVRARVDHLAPAAKAALLAAAPRFALRFGPLVVQVLLEAPREAGPLLAMLVEQGRAGIELVGEALVAGGAGRWEPEVRDRAMQALVAAGVGRALWMPLLRSADTPLAVRLAAIDAMCTDRGLRAELARWRPVPGREPRELCEKLAQLQWDEGEGG